MPTPCCRARAAVLAITSKSEPWKPQAALTSETSGKRASSSPCGGGSKSQRPPKRLRGAHRYRERTYNGVLAEGLARIAVEGGLERHRGSARGDEDEPGGGAGDGWLAVACEVCVRGSGALLCWSAGSQAAVDESEPLPPFVASISSQLAFLLLPHPFSASRAAAAPCRLSPLRRSALSRRPSDASFRQLPPPTLVGVDVVLPPPPGRAPCSGLFAQAS